MFRYDCFAGAVIGTVMAFSAYRMVYASVWDFRFNHIPLTRHTPFSYGAGAAGAGGFETTVFTRKAGWGYEEAFGGAPFDAAHHLRGAQAGFNNAIHHHDRESRHDHHERHGNDRGIMHGHQGQPDHAHLGNTRRDGDVEYNAAMPPEPMTDSSDNRYHMHSRSLERKAINRHSGGL